METLSLIDYDKVILKLTDIYLTLTKNFRLKDGSRKPREMLRVIKNQHPGYCTPVKGQVKEINISMMKVKMGIISRLIKNSPRKFRFVNL